MNYIDQTKVKHVVETVVKLTLVDRALVLVFISQNVDTISSHMRHSEPMLPYYIFEPSILVDNVSCK